ncbi:hypothetical protein EC968_008472 [Mortierella alpina]|nr:hypothetical protein EC968_008472 [Mortierella alpina]
MTARAAMAGPRSQTIRNAWNWSKIKPDPKKPFFAQRSTRNTPHTAVVLLRNADIPMLQIKPPVFMPATADQESSAYSKVGFGAYEDAVRVKDQYGITCKNIFDIHWMAKVLGIGSTNVGMLHSAFGESHDDYIPGRIQHHHHPDNRHAIPTHNQSSALEQGQLIDPRHWDWESHGDIELSRELIRLKGPFMGADFDSVVRDAQALALVKLLIENQSLIPDRTESTSLSFRDPTVLSRRVALPGIRSSEAILTSHQTRKVITEAFGCRVDELRLLQDADLSRKPDKIQDLECFLGLYEWLEFLPGAELEETKEQLLYRLSGAASVMEPCGRKEQTLLALYMNFGSIAARAKDRPSETREWVRTRVERLVRQDHFCSGSTMYSKERIDQIHFGSNFDE